MFDYLKSKQIVNIIKVCYIFLIIQGVYKMKTTSYGVLVIENINGEDHLFMCHSTNNTFWDIPKGGSEDKEKPIDSAIREFREETGNIATKNDLVNLGIFQYNYKKDLHLFLYKGEYIYPENSKCHSLFIFNNKAYPEVDDFKYVPFSLVKEHCSKSFIKTFDLILNKLEKNNGF